MKSAKLGTNTSEAEVTNVSREGLWLLLGDREHFLPFSDFPWFQDASIREICHVELLGEDHLHWPALDVDLTLESVEHPDHFPLVSQVRSP